jgi:hypothetical protein
MSVSLLACLGGAALAWATLRDVFGTVVIPGESHSLLKIPRRLVRATLPLRKRLGRRGIGVGFAPMVLVASFAVWMALLVLAFGLLAFGVRDAFTPPLHGLGEAMYRAAGAMTTMGLGHKDATGPASFVSVLAGFCGLAVMTLAITYLLEVQSNIAHRDTQVLKITTTAGHTPSALGLLERYAALGCRCELPELLRQGRDWCAGLLQSHASHPSLIYYRSVGTASGWPATLGVLVDLSLIAQLLLQEPQARAPAVLARDQAHRLGCDLAELLRLELPPEPLRREQVEALCERLRDAGYELREDRDLDGFVAARAKYGAPSAALSRHLGTAHAPLLPSGQPGDGEGEDRDAQQR